MNGVNVVQMDRSPTLKINTATQNKLEASQFPVLLSELVESLVLVASLTMVDVLI
jgi:hypothetical protein